MRVRLTPPGGGMHARPLEGPPAWAYVQNGVHYGGRLTIREGTEVYFDHGGTTGDERGRAVIPFPDSRGYNLVFLLRDLPDTAQIAVSALSGTNLLSAPAALASSGVGFPTWTRFGNSVLVARRGDPLRVIGVDDGGEIYFENVRARDRDRSPLDVQFDDTGPYLPAAPRGHLVHGHLGRAFVFDGALGRWSNLFEDFEAWPAGNFNDFYADLGGVVTAADTVGDYLSVFGENAIVIGIGDDYADGGIKASWRRREGPGTWSPRSLVHINGVLWFLARTGEVCTFDGSAVRSVTRPVADYLRPQTRLAFDPLRFRRPEQADLTEACAVWYEPWSAYCVFMHGETPWVFDLGFLVNVNDGRVSVLTGLDAQAVAVKVGDAGSCLFADRFGTLHVMDRGAVDRPTAELNIGGLATRSWADTRIPFIALPWPPDMQKPTEARVSAVRLSVEHLDARAPTTRAVEETLELKGTYRLVQNRPVVGSTRGANDPAAYLADTAVADEDFVIGTHRVAPDGYVPVRASLGGTVGSLVSVVVSNDATADGEADATGNPDQVGLGTVAYEFEPQDRA